MSGYEGTHQDWLEGQAEDHELREEFERDGGFHARRVDIGGAGGEVVFAHGDGVLSIVLNQAGRRITHFSMDHDIAVRFANAILSEIEVAQRLTDAEFGAEPHVDHCNCTARSVDRRCRDYRLQLDG